MAKMQIKCLPVPWLDKTSFAQLGARSNGCQEVFVSSSVNTEDPGVMARLNRLADTAVNDEVCEASFSFG